MNKIDFCIVISVDGANPNGDPLNNNMPRMNYDGYGEISDVCLKRKIRNYLQDIGESIFVQSNDRIDDGCRSLKSRANSFDLYKNAVKNNDPEECKRVVCEKWIDVRTFGQVFAFKGALPSVDVRGPVTISFAKSLDVIDIRQIQITKSTNLIDADVKDSSTMSIKYIVHNAAYVAYGSIFPKIAEKTGFTEGDAEKIHQALIHLLDNDATSARPAGSMNVQRVYWWKHKSPIGQYSPIQVFRSLEFQPLPEYPFFTVAEKPLENLKPEVYILK